MHPFCLLCPEKKHTKLISLRAWFLIESGMTRLTVSTVEKNRVFLVLSLDIFYFAVLLSLFSANTSVRNVLLVGHYFCMNPTTKLELTSQRESKISVSNKSSQL